MISFKQYVRAGKDTHKKKIQKGFGKSAESFLFAVVLTPLCPSGISPISKCRNGGEHEYEFS
jgi:hypothetical protein